MAQRLTYLQKGMSCNDTQKALQTLPPALYDLIRETVGEDLAGERRNVDTR